MDKKGQLEVEIIRARGLVVKPGSKTLPGKGRKNLVTILAQGQGLDLIIIMGSFQLCIFYGSENRFYHNGLWLFCSALSTLNKFKSQ